MHTFISSKLIISLRTFFMNMHEENTHEENTHVPKANRYYTGHYYVWFSNDSGNQVFFIQIFTVFLGGVKRNLFPNNEREEPQDGRRYNSWHNLVTKFILNYITIFSGSL